MVRQQSVRNSFTKDKAGTLPFHMYMSEESHKNAQEQALTSMQELFKAVSSAKEADTSTHPPGNSSSSDEEPVTEPGHAISTRIRHHILEFMQSEANPTFFRFLFQAR